ncbi:alpha/beta hydrolase family protein [Brevibacterium sp. UCMA 11754]|uniref:alpha/beta hydrolase family protein n=1 Tax=Brevibacterium sp. UCMA 11754 TaxID=2749198 RepID=UPI001F43ECEC|nr:prolyl oligopeptidase family serine peptidase [Brevibacterium sp. UCMA 11754]MCF2571124.1 prolyl oligopeptidase family serine peptidase [Brevibacterium sp. UCMA 11754]
MALLAHQQFQLIAKGQKHNMYTYFSDYPADLALSMALDMGANIDEIDRSCSHLRGGKLEQSDEPSLALFEAWLNGADQLRRRAENDVAEGHTLSGAEKFRRATIMYLTGERLPNHSNPDRHAAYDRVLECFAKYVEYGEANCERVLVPFEQSVLPSLFVRAEGTGPAPCLVHFNGLDGIKEFLFLTGYGQALSRRGISVLFVDNPGVGEALRKHDLHNSPNAELPASACLDYLKTRTDVDSERIGMAALSMGGYHAPRAAAFEKRFRCCIAWGANYDWGKQFRERIAGQGTERSVPHVFEHVMWVLGAQSLENAAEIADGFTLEGILEHITVPILITHGENDRQITVDKAEATFEECTNSPNRELRIFTSEEGGDQHCHIGNMSPAIDYMADWAREVLSS